MIAAQNLEMDFPQATDGNIAAINLESARERSWSQFWRAPQAPGIAEYIIDQEQIAAQFRGDFGALDRLETLVHQLAKVDAEAPPRRSLINHAKKHSLITNAQEINAALPLI